jgi:hypothetical protein
VCRVTAALVGAVSGGADDDGTFVCRVDALAVGDQVLTPAHRWETVTGLGRGDGYCRSTRVATGATGPDFPYEWVNTHIVAVRPDRDARLTGRGRR